jgi:hypothetical protein
MRSPLSSRTVLPSRAGGAAGAGLGMAKPGLARVGGRAKVEWGLPHRGRISPEEAAWVREQPRVLSTAANEKNSNSSS